MILSITPNPFGFSEGGIAHFLEEFIYPIYFWLLPTYHHFAQIPTENIAYTIMGINIIFNSLILAIIIKFLKS
jgi:hypothetical protein